MPKADVKQIWRKEMNGGSAPDRATKIIAGVFDVPLDYAAARVVGLGLTAKGKARGKPKK